MGNSAHVTEVTKIQSLVVKAILARDTDYFEKVIADEFQFTNHLGKIISKREDIDQYKSGDLTVNRFDVENQTVHIFGTTAIVRFKVTIDGKFQKWEFSTPYQFTRVYAKNGDDWKMVAGHSSELKK